MVADAGQVGGDDAEPAFRIGGQLPGRPGCDGRAFGSDVGARKGSVQAVAPQGYFLRGAVDRDLSWHFIGPLQSNKTRLVAEHYAWVHSIERLKIAERLSAQRPAQLPPLQVCVQINVSGEASKSGVAPAQLSALAHAMARLPRLQLRGLMAIPEHTSDESVLAVASDAPVASVPI